MDAIVTLGLFALGGWAAWRGGRALDRAFALFGAYAAGPRPYPDQDPAPGVRATT